MSSTILFRSLKSGSSRSGPTHTTIRQRGSSWSHIRSYTDTDDIRDIVWTKIRPEGISVREREDYRDFEIITYWGTTPYDDFFDIDLGNSKKKAIEKARHTIASSAHLGHYGYQEYYGNTGLERIMEMKPRNTLIFICNTAIIPDISLLAFHNDLIYMDLIHPYENHPHHGILFSGQVLDLYPYLEAYNTEKQTQRDMVKKIRGSYISLSTEDDITNVLNTFFIKRYTHG